MKSSTRYETEDKMHPAKIKAKKVVRDAGNKPDIEAVGNAEKHGGVEQENNGEVKRTVGK
ncbi:hypothetical protein [Desulfonatronum lacustre]|uniref:hypothetical protein n=1 Tax=Desulfonatronum lacustre TaxID=66849 RepID=UPI00048B33A3|nr:hypothetical protein [Desulfonatronum lacustre]SMP73694.1 hypothetical protein SAMN06295888_12142 [Desulfonatronum zhilinae]